MDNVRGKVIGVLLVFIINGITIFLHSDDILKYIISFIPDGIYIIAMSPSEVLAMSISISALLSFIILIPIITYYSFSYISDAMYSHERRVLKGILFFGMILFFIGFFISFIAFTKGGLPWLARFNISHGLETLWSLNATIYSMLAVGFAAGITFELPMILYFLIRYKFINFKMNKENRSMTLLVLAVLFAVITPDGSGATQLGLMLPIYILIEISTYLGNKNKLQEVKK